MPVIVFFGIATAVAILTRGVGALRLRAVARRDDASPADLCQLEKANRITSGLGAAALFGLAVAVLVRAVTLL